jgi:hypothetical protein
MPRGRLTAILKDGPVLAVDVERMRRGKTYKINSEDVQAAHGNTFSERRDAGTDVCRRGIRGQSFSCFSSVAARFAAHRIARASDLPTAAADAVQCLVTRHRYACALPEALLQCGAQSKQNHQKLISPLPNVPPFPRLAEPLTRHLHASRGRTLFTPIKIGLWRD